MVEKARRPERSSEAAAGGDRDGEGRGSVTCERVMVQSQWGVKMA
jgi:hypothetical protein